MAIPEGPVYTTIAEKIDDVPRARGTMSAIEHRTNFLLPTRSWCLYSRTAMPSKERGEKERNATGKRAGCDKKK